ncbi:MAG: transporter [Proteobacteria bacterium]|nr:transporter [Pseudomonadota bacterium]
MKPITIFLVVSLLLALQPCIAHDPIFSPGPHVLYKKGVEINAGTKLNKRDNNQQSEQSLSMTYGVTGDWAVGIELPYVTTKSNQVSQSGLADVVVSSKYRFWRKDSLGEQSSAAFLTKVNLDSSNSSVASNTTDVLLGLTYGYESLKWYRWASVRYRINQRLNDLQRGNRLFVDLAGGVRPKINDYRKTDTVLLLELNGEFTNQTQVNGLDTNNSGGNQWFVSPGVMWTLRNFAIRTGVQIPVINNLNGNQKETDYRAFLEFEWHY